MYFAVTEKDSNEIIGYTSISDIDYRNGKCFWSGIKLSPAVSGKGYGFQIALKVLKYVFEELRMVRCIGMCQEDHTPAIKLMLKAGYEEEGLMRKYLFKNGEYVNVRLYSVTDDDYKTIKEKHNL
jgi:RimJ/RimL family protein N-acetyltransferase